MHSKTYKNKYACRKMIEKDEYGAYSTTNK